MAARPSSIARAFALALLLWSAPAAAGEVEWQMLVEQANLHMQRGSHSRPN